MSVLGKACIVRLGVHIIYPHLTTDSVCKSCFLWRSLHIGLNVACTIGLLICLSLLIVVSIYGFLCLSIAHRTARHVIRWRAVSTLISLGLFTSKVFSTLANTDCDSTCTVSTQNTKNNIVGRQTVISAFFTRNRVGVKYAIGLHFSRGSNLKRHINLSDGYTTNHRRRYIGNLTAWCGIGNLSRGRRYHRRLFNFAVRCGISNLLGRYFYALTVGVVHFFGNISHRCRLIYRRGGCFSLRYLFYLRCKHACFTCVRLRHYIHHRILLAV